MKMVFLIARILLGFLFLVIGFNGFFHFIPAPAPSGVSGQFVGAMYVSHYLAVVWLVQIGGGALLVINRFVPAALNTLGPVLVNIVLFHTTMSPVGYTPAVIAIVLWGIVFYQERAAFRPLMASKPLPAIEQASA
jgi:putative oxidoreductase